LWGAFQSGTVPVYYNIQDTYHYSIGWVDDFETPKRWPVIYPKVLQNESTPFLPGEQAQPHPKLVQKFNLPNGIQMSSVQ
jgi:hypothetical protein